MRRIVLIAVAVVSAVLNVAPAFAGVDVNHNETLLRVRR
jgi:hypothetical protein